MKTKRYKNKSSLFFSGLEQTLLGTLGFALIPKIGIYTLSPLWLVICIIKQLCALHRLKVEEKRTRCKYNETSSTDNLWFVIDGLGFWALNRNYYQSVVSITDEYRQNGSYGHAYIKYCIKLKTIDGKEQLVELHQSFSHDSCDNIDSFFAWYGKKVKIQTKSKRETIKDDLKRLSILPIEIGVVILSFWLYSTYIKYYDFIWTRLF